MTKYHLALGVLACAVLSTTGSAQQPAAAKAAPRLYNTAKQKLLEGKQVFSFTQTRFDVAGYCEQAKHYDYAWFEMQHSTLEFRDVEAMIAGCPTAAAIPMIRLPDAQEWHIQHALDIGALGVIIPTVDDVERARKLPSGRTFPQWDEGVRGGGQAGRIWGVNGVNYRNTFNDNVLVVVMIESPTGVANAHEIAATPGVDVVIIGNADFTNFSGFPQNDERYQAMVTKVHDETLKAGKIWGQANANYAKNHPLSKDAFFFQNGTSFDG